MPATLVTHMGFYRDEKTGRRVPESQEKGYRQRYRKKHGYYPKKEYWLYTVDGKPNERRKGIKIGNDWHRVQIKVKVTQAEKILPLSGFTKGHIWNTLVKHKVFERIWTNWGGVIRVTVSGMIPPTKSKVGRRVKEIIHLGFHKEHWELSQKRAMGGRVISGRQMYREWLTAKISAALQRRGYRLSSPEKSAERVQRLKQELNALNQMTPFVDPEKMGGHMSKVKWKETAIQRQLRTRQLRGATIKIEKLV